MKQCRVVAFDVAVVVSAVAGLGAGVADTAALHAVCDTGGCGQGAAAVLMGGTGSVGGDG